MLTTEKLANDLKIYLELADPALMNDVLMFALTKLSQELTEGEIEQFSHCHKLLTALGKQKPSA